MIITDSCYSKTAGKTYAYVLQLPMLRHVIFALFFLGYFSARAADESTDILRQALVWADTFSPYVQNDPGFIHFGIQALQAETNKDEFCHFEQVSVCTLFTHLRCATCFAMTINERVDEGTFASALETCHPAEIYQILVAADSYYKGQGNSKKFQALKHLTLQNLEYTTQEQEQDEIYTQITYKYKTGIFERDLTWLRTWENSHEKLSCFLKHHASSYATNIFDQLTLFLHDAPYALHHLEKAHFQKYAHTLIPALLKGNNLPSLSQKMHISFPGDPQKEELFSLFHSLSQQTHASNLHFVPQAISVTTGFDYYTQHHAPYIFEIHERVMNYLYQQFEQCCSPCEKSDCQKWLKWIKDNNTHRLYSLHDRHVTLEVFHTLRCCILWRLSQKERHYPGFFEMYAFTSYSEKKALRLNTQKALPTPTRGTKILENVSLANPTRDLCRISLACLFETER